MYTINPVTNLRQQYPCIHPHNNSSHLNTVNNKQKIIQATQEKIIAEKTSYLFTESWHLLLPCYQIPFALIKAPL